MNRVFNFTHFTTTLFFTTVILTATTQSHSKTTQGKRSTILIPTAWLQIKTPTPFVSNAIRLLDHTGNATWGDGITFSSENSEFTQAEHAGYQGLKLRRDISFNGITLKKGCLLVLIGFPMERKDKYRVGMIECQNAEAIIYGKRISGVFDDFETGGEGILAPTLDPIVVKESFKLPNGQLIKAGTRLDANSQWFPDHATNSLRIVESPRDQE